MPHMSTEAAPKTFTRPVATLGTFEAPTPLTPAKPSSDTLIFRVSDSALSLVGGSGRGAGWMGIVDLPREGEPLAVGEHRH